MTSSGHAFCALVGSVLLTAMTAPSAASQGTITGQVLSAESNEPLPSVQVNIETLDLGALSQASGRYILLNIPAGTHTVTAQRIGYRAVIFQVMVGAGETAVQDLRLQEEALRLDEIIVTGTAGGTQRRAIGNVVDRLPVAEILSANAGAISSIEDVLSDRIPGVAFLPPPGVAGAGGQIRIRGSSSAVLMGDPLIYVDGIRMNSARGQVGRYSSLSRLNDIDPANIESIEVIKGPAAATLYGTEASNGVIQIITKRGVEGPATFNASVEVGQMRFPVNTLPTLWVPDPARCPTLPCQSRDDLISLNPYEIEKEEQGLNIFPPGLTQRYNLSVQGGSALFQYYAAVDRSDENGVVTWNWDKRNSLTASLALTPRESLTFSLKTQLNSGESAAAGSFWAGTFGWGGRPASYIAGAPRRGFSNPPERYAHNAQSDITETNRSLVSFEARFQPVDWLSHRLVFGRDRFTSKNVNQTFKDNPAILFTGLCGRIGCKNIELLDQPVTTLDFSGTASFQPSERLRSETSYGLQYYHTESTLITSEGEEFATSALKTVGAAAVTAAGESFVENTTLGVYVQQQFGWQGRLFLTGAIRADDNSAFGTNFDAAIYPKLSTTWVMHEEPFWNLDFVNQFRVRAAWGRAGQQPDAFASSRLYTPNTGPDAEPILTAATIGNADLGPEQGEELEFGFDAEFGGRWSVSYTRFERTTKNALVSRPVAPSLGFEGESRGSTGFASKLENVGEIDAWGNELAVNVQALTGDPLRWDLSLALSTWGNRIVDLGGVDRIQIQRSRAHVEGFPLASIIDHRVLSADFVSGDRGSVTNLMCDSGTGIAGQESGGPALPCADAGRVFWGQTEPKWVVNLGSTWTFFQDWTVSANIAAQGGHWMASDYLGARHTTFPSSEMVFLQDNPIGLSYVQLGRSPLTFHEAGFAKLREVSLRYRLPTALVAKIGADRASFILGARNLANLWFAGKCPPTEPRVCAADPEMNRPNEDYWGEAAGSMPPVRRYTIGFTTSF